MAFLCSHSCQLLSSSSSYLKVATSATPHLYSREPSACRLQQKRKPWRACCPTMSSPVLDEPAMMELPCLPFNLAEVFIPTATKTLHLYEARFLALLEEAISKYNNMFAHIVIEPVSDNVGVLSYATKFGCLAQIENVRRLEIGALVIIRGVGRVNLAKVTQLEPFLKGSIVPVRDAASTDLEDVDAAVESLKSVLADVQQLQIKLRTSKDELLQTSLGNSLQWAEKGVVQEAARSFVPSKAESLAFAALQPVTRSTAAELFALLQERIYAMEATNTLQRLQKVTKLAEQNRSFLAVKVALESLQF